MYFFYVCCYAHLTPTPEMYIMYVNCILDNVRDHTVLFPSRRKLWN